MAIRIRTVGLLETLKGLDSVKAQVRAATAAGVSNIAVRLIGNVKRGLHSGIPGRPRSRTGAAGLSGGIMAPVEEATNGFRINLGVDARIPYARILEEGGTQPARDIYPKRAQALMWIASGGGRAVYHATLAAGKTYKRARRLGTSAGGNTSLAFAKHVHQPARYQRAMPYLAPEVDDMQASGLMQRIIRRQIDAALGG